MYYARIGQQEINVGTLRILLPEFNTHAEIDAWIDQAILHQEARYRCAFQPRDFTGGVRPAPPVHRFSCTREHAASWRVLRGRLHQMLDQRLAARAAEAQRRAAEEQAAAEARRQALLARQIQTPFRPGVPPTRTEVGPFVRPRAGSGLSRQGPTEMTVPPVPPLRVNQEGPLPVIRGFYRWW